MLGWANSFHTLLKSFNIDSTSLQHVSIERGGGGGGEGGSLNIAVPQNQTDVEANVETVCLGSKANAMTSLGDDFLTANLC